MLRQELRIFYVLVLSPTVTSIIHVLLISQCFAGGNRGTGRLTTCPLQYASKW